MAAVSKSTSVYQTDQGKDFSYSYLKKRDLELQAAADTPATKTDIPNANKKKCLRNPEETSLSTVDTTIEDSIREKFLKSLCFQWQSLRSETLTKSTVYVISSGLQNRSEKLTSAKHAIVLAKRTFPDHSLEMVWVKIPKDEFFTSCHFEKMMETIYSIPFHSTICLQTGNAIFVPSLLPDKVIFYESEQLSPNLQMICKIYQARYPYIPHYYVNAACCHKPKLTGRSVGYAIENGCLTLQSSKNLIAMGFQFMTDPAMR